MKRTTKQKVAPIEQQMARKQKEEHQRRLAAFEALISGLHDRINRRIPADSVPDRIALPILDRLEWDAFQLDDAAETIRRIAAKYAD